MSTIINKVRRRARWLWNDLYYQCLPSGYWKGQKGQRIFIYHGIDQTGSLDYNTRFISSDYFEKQLAFFKEHFHVATLSDYLKGNYPDDRFTIVLTFDDGYLNNLELALPLLEKYELPATFFITSIRSADHDILWSDHLDLGFRFSHLQIDIEGRKFVKGPREFIEEETGLSLKNVCRQSGFEFKCAMMLAISDEFRREEELSVYWQLMDEEQLRRLNASPYVTIGSHGHFHNNYACVSEEDALVDLQNSKSYLEDVLQDEIVFLAYPDGSYNQSTVDLAEKAGYQRQFAVDYVDPDHESDSRVWPRFVLNPYIKLHHQAKAIVYGQY